MKKYAEIIDKKTGACNVGIGTNEEYYKSIGYELLDVTQSEIDDNWYLTDLCPHYTEKQKLKNAKVEKIEENDTKRDDYLNSGVTYSNVLFDSDTDQKINIMAMVSTMSDDDTITWYGKDNQGLLCTKADLLAIGGLISKLHTYCWDNNAYIKDLITNASTVEEVKAIEVNYELQ